MEKLTARVPVPVTLVAPSVAAKLPTVLGVPDTRPLSLSSDKPGGRAPASTLKLLGAFDAVIW